MIPDRFREVISNAEDAFWRVIAEGTPETRSGDLAPDVAYEFTEACKRAASEWYETNVREGAKAAEPIRRIDVQILDWDDDCPTWSGYTDGKKMNGGWECPWLPMDVVIEVVAEVSQLSDSDEQEALRVNDRTLLIRCRDGEHYTKHAHDVMTVDGVKTLFDCTGLVAFVEIHPEPDLDALAEAFEERFKTYTTPCGTKYVFEFMYPGFFAFHGRESVFFTPDWSDEGEVSIAVDDDGDQVGLDSPKYQRPLTADTLMDMVRPWLDAVASLGVEWARKRNEEDSDHVG